KTMFISSSREGWVRSSREPAVGGRGDALAFDCGQMHRPERIVDALCSCSLVVKLGAGFGGSIVARVDARPSKAMQQGCRPQARTRTGGGTSPAKPPLPYMQKRRFHADCRLISNRICGAINPLTRQCSDTPPVPAMVSAATIVLLPLDSAETSAQSACGLAGAKAYRVAEFCVDKAVAFLSEGRCTGVRQRQGAPEPQRPTEREHVPN